MPDINLTDENIGKETKPPAGMGWLLPLLLLVLTVGLIFYFTKSSNEFVAGIMPQQDSTNVQTAAKTDTSARKHIIQIQLPDSTEIAARQNGIEESLFQYIISTKAKDSISKNRWFDFDDLNFKLSSAEITDSSMHQVHNIAAILKAFPKVKIKISGYTDKTGDEASNMKLSQSRADAVVDMLKDMGANPKQLVGAEGYGSAYAKVPANAPDEERKKDRRISISVRAK